jgi:diguanylate cyclase (GGDEF)-like protein
MDNEILASVIEITGQRDLDSLEFSLVASLADMLPVASISIFKKHNENITRSVEEVINLKVSGNTHSKQDYRWSDTARVVETDELTEQCLLSSNVLSKRTENGYRNVFPISAENITIGSLCIDSDEDITDKTELIENIIKIYSNYLTILIESERDKLTGLFNRRTFDKKLGRLLQTQTKKKELYLASGAKKERRESDADSHAWLVVLDLDNFKTINDTYGHIYGDEILLTLSQKMKEFFRNTDLLFRFGGDEFVIVMEPVTFKNASHTLESFRKMIAEINFPLIGKITISAGFAIISEKDYAPTVLNRADKALYHAKKCGRNTVCNYEVLLEQGELSSKQSAGAIDLF